MTNAKILIASLVDPATHPGAVGAYIRGLVAALRRGKDRFDAGYDARGRFSHRIYRIFVTDYIVIGERGVRRLV